MVGGVPLVTGAAEGMMETLGLNISNWSRMGENDGGDPVLVRSSTVQMFFSGPDKLSNGGSTVCSVVWCGVAGAAFWLVLSVGS